MLKECTICGKEYESCPKCENTRGWKFYTDTPEHYQVHAILCDFRNGVYDIESAKKAFSDTLGISAESDLSWMLSAVERDVRKIVGNKHQKTDVKKEKHNK